MKLVSQYLFRVRRFFIAVLSVTVGSVLVLPVVTAAWSPTTPPITVAIFEGELNLAESGNSVAVDSLGNVYTTGNFSGTVDFDPGAGTYYLTSAGVYDVFVSKLSPAGDFVWAKKIGGNSWDSGESVAVDSSGNVYTTGYFNGTVDFDPGAGTPVNLTSAGGSSDVFVSKLSPLGAYIWAKQFGGLDEDSGYSVAVDSSGNVYTTGNFEGSADFDPGAGAQDLTSAGNKDVFVSKLSPLGAYMWAKKFGDIGYDSGRSVAVDSSGNVYTTGGFQGTVDFDPGAGAPVNLISSSGEVFVSKLSSSGVFVWAKQIGGVGFGFSVAVDSLGNVYTTGYFNGTADFDPGAGAPVNLISTGGSDDMFVSKLSPSGVFVWAKKIGDVGEDWGYSVAVDSLGNVYTTGYFNGTADFDPGAGAPVNLISTENSDDMFVSKLSPAGDFVWAKKIGGAHTDFGRSVAVDSSGYVYTTGSFQGTADFDTGDDTNYLTSTGNFDVFVMRLSQLGDSLVSAATTTTTTVPVTTTTTVLVTTTTAVPVTTTTAVPVTAATVPARAVLVVKIKKSVTAKAIANYAQLAIKTRSVVKLKVATASYKFCKVSGARLRGLKLGSCKVKVTVKPANGKSVSKTVTLKVSK